MQNNCNFINIMLFKFKENSKELIISILKNKLFDDLNKSRKKFILTVFMLFLGIKGKINFLQLERNSNNCEQMYRLQFAKTFDFISFNKELIGQVCSEKRIIAFDPTYIPKAGKCTYGGGYFWSGTASTTKWGLEFCGFAVIDVNNNTGFHLKAFQTPPVSTIKEKGLTLLDHYANLTIENREVLKSISNYTVADSYFAKKKSVDAALQSDLHFISRLRDDGVMKFLYKGEPTGKKGRSKKYDGKVNIKNINTNYFELDYETDDIKIYSAVVYCQAFKRNIKCAITIFYKNGKEIKRKIYFSTDLKQSGEELVKYYRSRFQIEFIYRDAKQHTGLTNCQARSEAKLDFHVNASLTAVNLAKYDWLMNKR